MARKRRVDFPSQKKAVLLAKIAEGKRGEDILVLQVREILVITDFFVLVTGMNRRQLQAIAQEMMTEMKARKMPPLNIGGYEQGWWVVLDCEDVVVHLFQRDAREYYNLENLWGDVPQIDWKRLKGSVRKKAAR